MSAVVSYMGSPRGAVVAMAIAAIWIATRPRSAMARAFLFFAAFGYLAASIYVVPDLFASLLASGYERFEKANAPHGRIAVVVLGAGAFNVGGWEDQMAVPTPVAVARVLEARRVFRLVDASWIISSGGNATSDGAWEPPGVTMQKMFISLGIPDSRIVVETKSQNTHDEAVIVASMLPSLGADSVILVTSADHMRRSVGSFRAAGVTVTPAIAPDPGFDVSVWNKIVPTEHGLDYSSEVLHEFGGIPLYWLRGWWK
ncbi:MAG TPA: YdcF family protein [Vicinamibacterales bacterium]|nr:YdcF family protein [Vicinamibacterales bacterium]